MPDLWWNRDLPRTGVGWYHTRVIVADSLPAGGFGLLFEKIYIAGEVYWDGELIGRNGVVAHTSHDEIPGNSVYLCPIPSHLATPGAHQLALRVSNHHAWTGGISLAPKIGATIPWSIFRAFINTFMVFCLEFFSFPGFTTFPSISAVANAASI